MPRPEILDLVGRGGGQIVLADHEPVLAGDIKAEVGAVRDHVEGCGPDDGIESDDANISRLAEENVSADVLVFGNSALLGAAQGGDHVHGGAEIPNPLELLRDAAEQSLNVGGGQGLGGRVSVAGDQAAPGKTGCEPQQDQE